MNDVGIAPESLKDLHQVVADSSCVLPVGNRTKLPLSQSDSASLVSLRSLRGIIEYEPSEFTFTAWAGTPLSEIRETLETRRQYMPFDPLLVEAGATLGGTIASGLSGPGRFRYGGVRDFLIGVKLLGDAGNLIQGGGKVVKNAAGFDLPKFLIGSLGRYAMLVDVSFKVFPMPPSMCTLKVNCATDQEAVQRIATIARSRWEPDAIDYRPEQRELFVRLGGPADSVKALAQEIRSQWNAGEMMNDDGASELWRNTNELSWAGSSKPIVVKVPTTGASFLSLHQRLKPDMNASLHLSVAAGVAWIALSTQADVAALDQTLTSLGMAGLVVRGECTTPRIGEWPTSEMQQAVKKAIDPHAKFAGI